MRLASSSSLLGPKQGHILNTPLPQENGIGKTDDDDDDSQHHNHNHQNDHDHNHNQEKQEHFRTMNY